MEKKQIELTVSIFGTVIAASSLGFAAYTYSVNQCRQINLLASSRREKLYDELLSATSELSTSEKNIIREPARQKFYSLYPDRTEAIENSRVKQKLEEFDTKLKSEIATYQAGGGAPGYYDILLASLSETNKALDIAMKQDIEDLENSKCQ